MPLELTAEQRESLARFRAEGLLWLVNAAVLHPRGWALAVHLDDDTGEVLGLSVVGDGSEPWCFGPELGGAHQSDAPFEAFKASESAREAAWAPVLRAAGPPGPEDCWCGHPSRRECPVVAHGDKPEDYPGPCLLKASPATEREEPT